MLYVIGIPVHHTHLPCWSVRQCPSKNVHPTPLLFRDMWLEDQLAITTDLHLDQETLSYIENRCVISC